MREKKEKELMEMDLKASIKILKLPIASLIQAVDVEKFLAYHNELVEAINDAGFTIMKDVKKYDKIWKITKN